VIPFDYITEWRSQAPWTADAQVEQDLVVSRALAAIFGDPAASRRLAFRGGTALYKLYVRPPTRYSEDIDLVQVAAEPVGDLLDAVRQALDPWLGTPRRIVKGGGVTLVYRAESEARPPTPLRLKVEVNTREHFSVFGFEERDFAVRSRWFSGDARITTYCLDELLGTKLRALYQRKKGRDLFDLFVAGRNPGVSPARVVECFGRYLERTGLRVTRAEFEMNLREKLADGAFIGDIAPLVAPDFAWSVEEAARYVQSQIVPLIPGEPWRGGE